MFQQVQLLIHQPLNIIVDDNASLVCPLAGKIIQGIARHLFIVSHRWLNECLSQESIVDERPYEIRGDTSLGCDHGGMRRSRLTLSYLLDKYFIGLRCSSNDCTPLQTIDPYQELIELCGGKLVQSFSEIKTNDKERQMILVLGVNGFSGGDTTISTIFRPLFFLINNTSFLICIIHVCIGQIYEILFLFFFLLNIYLHFERKTNFRDDQYWSRIIIRYSFR
jgi:hypothetical protein